MLYCVNLRGEVLTLSDLTTMQQAKLKRFVARYTDPERDEETPQEREAN